VDQHVIAIKFLFNKLAGRVEVFRDILRFDVEERVDDVRELGRRLVFDVLHA